MQTIPAVYPFQLTVPEPNTREIRTKGQVTNTVWLHNLGVKVLTYHPQFQQQTRRQGGLVCNLQLLFHWEPNHSNKKDG